jgi:hypothetical protein
VFYIYEEGLRLRGSRCVLHLEEGLRLRGSRCVLHLEEGLRLGEG